MIQCRKRLFTSHLNWTHWTRKRARRVMLEIQVWLGTGTTIRQV